MFGRNPSSLVLMMTAASRPSYMPLAPVTSWTTQQERSGEAGSVCCVRGRVWRAAVSMSPVCWFLYFLQNTKECSTLLQSPESAFIAYKGVACSQSSVGEQIARNGRRSCDRRSVFWIIAVVNKNI